MTSSDRHDAPIAALQPIGQTGARRGERAGRGRHDGADVRYLISAAACCASSAALV